MEKFIQSSINDRDIDMLQSIKVINAMDSDIAAYCDMLKDMKK